VEGLLQTFRDLVGEKFTDPEAVFNRIREEVGKPPALPRVPSADVFILPIEEIDSDKIRLVGSKAGNLGLIKKELGLPGPDGFAVTADGARYFISKNGLEDTVTELLSRLDPGDADALDAVSRDLQDKVRNAPVPDALASAIL
jgi:phosphoenolpyruvate synthase/pyruvate phosphate dikinase